MNTNDGDDPEEIAFLGVLNTNVQNAWYVLIQVAKQEIVFKMDTGADVTVLPAKRYLHFFKTEERRKPEKQIFGASKSQLKVYTMMLNIKIT